MKRFIIWILFLFIFISGVFSQEVSEKKEIAIFKLSYTDWSIPEGALGMVDQSIQNVFINLKRFNIIGMTHRLNSDDIEAFIDEIKKVKSSNIDIPESVRLGEETFTEADFNKLVGSFIIVIPAMTYFDMKSDDSGSYAAEIETSFTFINVNEGRAMAAFSIKTSGTDDTGKSAVKNAVEDIPLQLSYEIRKIPEFQLKTGIIDVSGRDVIIELGNNMGVKLGDEFYLTTSQVLSSGHTVERNSGLLVVKEVNEEVSTAQVFYSKKKPAIGDQLKEIPRLGFETAVYANYINSKESVLALGLRQIVARGFFSVRPFVGAEIPIGVESFYIFFPVNVYIGGEMNWYFGRLHVTPSVDVAMGMLIPVVKEYDDYVIYSSVGGHARFSVSYMMSDSIKIFMEGGYATMFAVSNLFDSYNGLFVGGGLTFKY